MNYALIENGVVVNMIVVAPYNAHEFPNAVAVEDKPVGIGDEYRDGKFWRGGEEILSELEQLEAYHAEVMAALPPETVESGAGTNV